MPCPRAPQPGCTSHSPGIRLTVILPGHDVFKQLPAGDAGETGTESPSHKGPRCRVFWKSLQKVKDGAQGPQKLSPKGRGPRGHGDALWYNSLPDFQSTSPPSSAFSSTKARLRSGQGVEHSEHVAMIHQALGNPRAGAFCCCCFLIDFFKE